MTATITRLRSTLALQMALDSKRRAARLSQLREEAHLTQSVLATKSGVSLRTIQRAENPNDPIELRHSTIEGFARAFKIKPEAITAYASVDTNGGTPDLMATVSGDSDLQHQLAAINRKLDLLLAFFGLDEQPDVVTALDDFAEAIRRGPLEPPAAGEGATGS